MDKQAAGSEQPSAPAVAPVVTVYPDGRTVVGTGYTVGDVLAALDQARRAVLGVVLNPARPEPQ